jgi:transcriptional regulator with XRE-family HTH domain
MLPKPTDPKFPEALKAAREAKGWNYQELADHVGISGVMPSRYENRDHSSFGPPSAKTWKKLNAALFRSSVTDAAEATVAHEGPTLVQASVEAIVAELKRRGATSVKIDF